MKRGIQFFILAAITLSLFSCKKNKPDIIYEKKYLEEIKSIRNELAFFMERNFIPGASFAISKNGEIVYSEGIGYASKELEVRVKRNNKFRIAELSELFTSVIYQMMVEDGILHPDSAIQFYLPDFPQKKYTVTLNDLANHTSGIRTPLLNEQSWNGSAVSLAAYIDNFRNDTLLFEPQLFQYPSTYNFDLLGAILEKAANKPFSNLLKEYITDTLNLSHTEVDNPFKIINGRVDFFEENISSIIMNAPFTDLRSRRASEGILSNAEDLVKFGNALLYSDIFSEEVKQRLFTPLTLKSGEQSRYSNGWITTQTEDGKVIYGLGGSVIGGGSTLLIYPDENLVVAATANLTLEMNNLPVPKMTEPFFDNDEN